VDSVVQDVVQVIACRDWEALRIKLHPYLHWRDAHGTRRRGRKNVIAMLMLSGAVDPPSSYELRDGQIYRWES
jgi:hypothetical protein